jgi:prephenate dehydrogenase
MAAAPAVRFRGVAILGTGLIGGSFGLAVRKHCPETRVVGWDKAEVLRQAGSRGAIHEGLVDLGRALARADLVYVALPIGLTLELLPEIARRAEPHALITDVCSTKAVICRAAASHFQGAARFLGGHPMAGKEVSGLAEADAELFRGAKYALIGEASDADPRLRAFAALVEAIGARPVWLDAETHDWAVAIVSHLPQLLSIAMAGVVRDEIDETGLPVTLAGRGLYDALRLAGSPYALWRDIALTNRENIGRALDRVAQAIDHLRMRLASRELEDEFDAANELYKMLRDLQ